MDRQQLVEAIRAGRARLETQLAQVKAGRMEEPALPNGWSVKDLLAHLGFWEQRIVDCYHALVNGQTPDPHSAGMSVDELNARAHTELHDRTLDDLRGFESEAYLSLLSIAKEAQEDELFDPSRFEWTQGKPFFEMIADNTYGHYAEHEPDLLAWLDKGA